MGVTLTEQHHLIALAGNPNVGKSTVFNMLTGLNQHTGNWPGKTVAQAQGMFNHRERGFVLVDLPGAYSLNADSPEEEVARDFLTTARPALTVVVADATCLERNLNLTLQIMAVCPRVILCVNLLDEAAKKKIRIDLGKLSQELGIAVVGASARSGRGLVELKDLIYEGAEGQAGPPPRQWPAPAEERIAAQVAEAERIYNACVSLGDKHYTAFDRRLDRLATSRATGIPLMLLLLAAVLWLTISGANWPSRALSVLFSLIEHQLTALLELAKTPAWLHGLLITGMFRTLAWVVTVMLPPMAIFFPLFTLLEDSGYLPRVAFNMDRFFKKAGACGKQCLTTLMGFGCNACGVIGCRIITSPRERLIAMLTNSFVPCNGRFPALIAVISVFFAMGSGVGASLLSALLLTAVIVLGITLTLAVSKLLSSTVLAGYASSFTLELPPYRRPQIGRVIVRSLCDRTLKVLGRAICVAAPAGAVIWLLANTQVAGQSLLILLTRLLEGPGRFIGLDGVILLAFILGFPANEIVLPLAIMGYLGANGMSELAGLAELRGLLLGQGWNSLTALCFMLFTLLHFPCATTCWTIRKESGSFKWTALAFALPTACGFIICGAVAQVARLCAWG